MASRCRLLSTWDYSTQSQSFESIGAVRGVSLTTGIGETPSAVDGVQVTRTLFDTLGVRPVLARAFTADEDASGRNHVAVLTYEFWQRAFGGDRDVLNRELTLRAGFTGTPSDAAQIDGQYSIIGVLPPRTTLLYRSADVWIPLTLNTDRLARPTAGLIVFARLRPFVSLATATSDVAAVARRLADTFPERNRGVTAWLVTLRAEDSGDITPTLMLLIAAVTLLSLIVCANIGNMLLGGLTERRQELSVRCALGASRARVVQQLLTESALLTAGGAVVGIVVAALQTRAFALAGPLTIPRVTDVRVDGWALAVALVTAAVMTALFAVAPATYASRMSGGSLGQRAGNVAGTARLRELLVVAEIALAFIVLVGAGLAIESAAALERTRLGYDPQHVLTFRTSLPYAKYSLSEQRIVFYRDVLERLRSLPAVTAAGAVNILPQMDTNANVQFELDDRPTQQAGDPFNVRLRVATTGYFRALGTPVIEGRDFNESDLSAGGHRQPIDARAVLADNRSDRPPAAHDAAGRQHPLVAHRRRRRGRETVGGHAGATDDLLGHLDAAGLCDSRPNRRRSTGARELGSRDDSSGAPGSSIPLLRFAPSDQPEHFGRHRFDTR
ncbi:MAG TPA: FtsX-like permease family protein [Vicinamibacterales bacterium]|nr:FtsX-like permease family protein [Vicinamibacterales bacterium]